LRRRSLGKTGLEVSAIGFGGFPLRNVPKAQASEALNHALNLGVNFVDTAREYGDSEEKIGQVLTNRRDDCLIATKTNRVDARGAWRDLRTSLKALRTDRIDLYQLHGPILNEHDGYRRALGPGGALGALKRAKRKGIVDHIGIALHWALDLMIEALRSGEFETIMVSYSAIDQEGVGKDVLPLAMERGLGVIVMKPLMEGDLTIPGSSGGNLAGFHGLPGRRVLKGDPLVATGLKFTLSNPAVSTVIPGMISIDEVEQNVRAGGITSTISDQEKRWLYETLGGLGRRFNPFGQVCLHCELCFPCPEGIDIIGAYRAAEMRAAPRPYFPASLRTLSVQLYRSLERKPSSCNRCGDCVPRCPAKLPIPDQLAHIANLFERRRE